MYHRIRLSYTGTGTVADLPAGYYLQISEGMAGVSVLSGALYEDLPTVVGLFPPQNEQRQRTGLQFILVKRQVVNDHRLLVRAGELERRMRGTRRQRARVHIRPEGFGQRPEADSESLLGGALDVDELATRVPGCVAGRYHRVGRVGTGAGAQADLTQHDRLQVHLRPKVGGGGCQSTTEGRHTVQQGLILVARQRQQGRVAARLLKVNHNTRLQLLD